MTLTESEIFILNVRYLVKKSGKKIQDFESDFGISSGYLKRMMNKKGGISLNVACEIARYLGMSLDDLVKEDIGRVEKIEQLEKELNELKKGLMSA